MAASGGKAGGEANGCSSFGGASGCCLSHRNSTIEPQPTIASSNFFRKWRLVTERLEIYRTGIAALVMPLAVGCPIGDITRDFTCS